MYVWDQKLFMHYFCGVLIGKCMLLYLEIMGRVVRYTMSSCRPLLAPIFLMLVVYILSMGGSKLLP